MSTLCPVEQSANAAPPTPAASLPLAGLLALAMTGFIAILTETLPAGLLPEISRGLVVPESWAGQLVTLYALGSVAAAIPMTAATRSWPRRTVLLLAIVGFLGFNTLTALSSWYWVTLIARFMAGVSAGITWGLVPGYARRMVAGPQQGRAMAIALVGTPIALALGVPAGTWLGEHEDGAVRCELIRVVYQQRDTGRVLKVVHLVPAELSVTKS